MHIELHPPPTSHHLNSKTVYTQIDDILPLTTCDGERFEEGLRITTIRSLLSLSSCTVESFLERIKHRLLHGKRVQTKS